MSPTPTNPYRSSYSGSTFSRGRNRKNDKWKIWIRVAAIIIGIPVVIGAGWFYTAVLQDLPDIEQIEDYSFKQATVITDRDGEVLYRLFEENREYIDFDQISPYFVDAIVSTEDQRFWDNPGIDIKGTIRAGLTDITQGKTQGGSTITQQLIKNVLLSPEKKFERKFKEIILALKINNHIEKEIRQTQGSLSSNEIDRKTKEKVLELYANLIFLGNNSYGVEVASKNYFDKSAIDLTILEAAVLAGLPQAPSTYDPFNNRGLLMGTLKVTDTTGTPVEMTDSLKAKVYGRIEANIDNSDVTFKRNESSLIEYFRGLLEFKIEDDGATYQIEYVPGRKDAVLARMYEDNKITENEFKTAFFEALDYKFKRGVVQIKAPHFVFWVTNLLEENYDPEILRKEGLTVKTSLDYDAQLMAEEAIKENESHLTGYEADNAALVYLDSQNGDVLAYVGSKDYYNEEIDGQVDILQSQRQPGSTIKPFVYALGFMKLALTVDSPIYDINFKIGNNTPQNADGSFTGLTTLRQALAGSRNIPAIKMFLAVGGEVPFKQFLNSIGVNSLDMTQEKYGYPLSIGAGEMKAMELAEAYTHLSAMGKPAVINPILEIRGSDGSILYQKSVETRDQIVPSGVAYLIWSILSDKSNYPSGRVNTFSFNGITFAGKSGTTNVVRGDDKLPRDGWLVNYTPTKVIVNRAGNTDGRAMRQDAFGGWLNSPIWKSFVGKLNEAGMIQDQSQTEMDVKTASISTISGKLASVQTPLAFVRRSLGYTKTLPTEVDTNVTVKKIDSLCGLNVSELTPESDIVNAYIVRPETILPGGQDQSNILSRRGGALERYTESVGNPILLEDVEGICDERNLIAELGEISMNILQPTPSQQVSREFTFWQETTSPFVISSMKLYLGTIELKSFEYNKQGNVIDISSVRIPDQVPPGTYTLRAVITDEKGYTDSQSVKIRLIEDDVEAPYLLENRIKITPVAGGRYEVVMLFADDAGTISEGTITKNGELVHSLDSNIAFFTLSELGTVSYSITDTSGNSTEGTATLTAPESDNAEEPVVDPIDDLLPDLTGSE